MTLQFWGQVSTGPMATNPVYQTWFGITIAKFIKDFKNLPTFNLNESESRRGFFVGEANMLHREILVKVSVKIYVFTAKIS